MAFQGESKPVAQQDSSEAVREDVVEELVVNPDQAGEAGPSSQKEEESKEPLAVQ